MTAPKIKKQWVYKQLVKDDKDFVGLIAYGFYKSRKTELADGYRRKRLSEEEIAKRLSDFHDQEVSGTGALDQYRHRAEQFYNQLLVNTHKSAKDEAFSAVTAAAREKQNEQRSGLYKFGLWCVSGIPSGIATVLITVVFFGVAMWLAGPQERGRVLSNLVNGAVGEELVEPKPEQKAPKSK